MKAKKKVKNNTAKKKEMVNAQRAAIELWMHAGRG